MVGIECQERNYGVVPKGETKNEPAEKRKDFAIIFMFCFGSHCRSSCVYCCFIFLQNLRKKERKRKHLTKKVCWMMMTATATTTTMVVPLRAMLAVSAAFMVLLMVAVVRFLYCSHQLLVMYVTALQPDFPCCGFFLAVNFVVATLTLICLNYVET